MRPLSAWVVSALGLSEDRFGTAYDAIIMPRAGDRSPKAAPISDIRLVTHIGVAGKLHRRTLIVPGQDSDRLPST